MVARISYQKTVILCQNNLWKKHSAVNVTGSKKHSAVNVTGSIISTMYEELVLNHQKRSILSPTHRTAAEQAHNMSYTRYLQCQHCIQYRQAQNSIWLYRNIVIWRATDSFHLQYNLLAIFIREQSPNCLHGERHEDPLPWPSAVGVLLVVLHPLC